MSLRGEVLAEVVGFIRRTPFVERSDKVRLALLQAPGETPRHRATLAVRWLQALARRDPKPLGDPAEVVHARVRLALADGDAGEPPPMDELLQELAFTLHRPRATQAKEEALAGILADIAAAAIVAGSTGR